MARRHQASVNRDAWPTERNVQTRCINPQFTAHPTERNTDSQLTLKAREVSNQLMRRARIARNAITPKGRG